MLACIVRNLLVIFHTKVITSAFPKLFRTTLGNPPQNSLSLMRSINNKEILTAINYRSINISHSQITFLCLITDGLPCITIITIDGTQYQHCDIC